MGHYYLNEAVLDLPDLGFVDTTIHGIEATQPSGSTLGVLVQRRPIEGATTLRALVDENLELNGRRLRAFVIERDREALIDGLPGLLLRVRWRSDHKENVQLQAHVVLDGTWLTFAVSAPLSESGGCEEAFARLLETLVLRRAS